MKTDSVINAQVLKYDRVRREGDSSGVGCGSCGGCDRPPRLPQPRQSGALEGREYPERSSSASLFGNLNGRNLLRRMRTTPSGTPWTTSGRAWSRTAGRRARAASSRAPTASWTPTARCAPCTTKSTATTASKPLSGRIHRVR